MLTRTLVFSIALAVCAGVLHADCEVGTRPGATLLFPYFEVDVDNPAGLTTLISVNSTSDSPTLARVVLWTDWSEAILSFDLFLGPQDVQTMNLRDVLAGFIPSTSSPDVYTRPGCTANPPSHGNPVLDSWQRDRVVFALTGQNYNGWCYGQRYPDRHARGFVTVDTVKGCSPISIYNTNTPQSSGYFQDLATAENVLWGDLIYVDPGGNSAQGVEAVALRGDDLNLGRATANTFYGKYVGWNGSDKRSPLPTLWTTRFLNGGAFDGGTDVIVFRDTRLGGGAGPCDGHPSWYPLFDASFKVRDEEGKVVLQFGPNGLFGLATQRFHVTDLAQSGLTEKFGRLDLALDWPDGTAAGAWVIPVMTASGRFSVDFNAQPIDTGCGR